VRRPVLLIAGAVVVVLAAFAGRYGYHRDELYFIECGRHLAWGYVDQPPFTPALARVATGVFGDSLLGLRVFPAVATGLVIVLAALTARELGATRRGEVLAATATAAASFFLGAGHLFSTTTFDNLFWTALIYVVVGALQRDVARVRWLVAGAIAGVGLLNKHSVAFLLGGVLIGVVLTRRDLLRSPWPWAGAAIAALIWAPNLVWHAQHDWPVVEMSRSLHAEGVADGNTVLFVPGQLVLFNPVGAVLWLAGLSWLLRDAAARLVRPVAIAYLALVAVFVVTAGKPYYLAGLYPALLAAGAVWAERRWTARRQRRYVGALVAVAVASSVVSLPVLPIGAAGDGLIAEIDPEHRESYGWPELVAAVERVTRPDDIVVTRNYGEAGALDVLGDDRLAVFSGHNNYWLWGPPPDDGRPVVLVGDVPGAALDGCVVVGRVRNPHGVPNDENGAAIRRCHAPRRPWAVRWASLRRYRA
jgi:hypothetical protein